MADEGVTCSGGKGWLYHPDFPAGWSRQSLHSLAQWVNGLAFRDIQFSPTGMPVIKIAEIKGGISDQTKRTQQTFDESVRVKFGDLLFSWSGQPETSIDAFWWRGPEGWLNQHVFRVTPKCGIEPVFFFYLLRYLKPHFVGIARNKQTTGLGHVTKRDLESIEAAFPEEHEQRAIAHILGTLDDRIELNRRMNQTLEAIARAMFQSWFIDFDPVRAKAIGEPQESICRRLRLTHDLLTLFPDRFVDSELGPIPEGWEVSNLGDLLGVLETGRRPKGGVGSFVGGVPSVGAENILGLGRYDYSKTRYVPVEFFTAMRAGHVEPWDVLLYKDGGKPGDFKPRVSMFGEGFPYERFAINEHVFRLRSGALRQALLFFQIEQERVLADLRHRGAKAAIPGINQNDVKTLRIVVPPTTLAEAFDGLVRPLVASILRRASECQVLANVRDALLPKIFTGQLRVPKDGVA